MEDTCRQTNCPCEFFQLNLANSISVPLGFCWKRQIELPFGGEICSACQFFHCGLLKPEIVVLTEESSFSAAGYHNEVHKARLNGNIGIVFGWATWQNFLAKVRNWKEKPTENSNSCSRLILRSGACKLFSENGLPDPLPDESVYAYFIRVFPKKVYRNSESHGNFVKFQAAIKRFIEKYELGIQVVTVISTARRLQKAGKTLKPLGG